MTPGLREQKKAATREALHDAAVRLATERGVENITVEAIADAAAVSRRTFSNYFAGKEQALLYRDRAGLARLVDRVRARPGDEPPVTALLRAAEELSSGPQDDPAREERYWRLRRDPALVAERAAVYASTEADLADAFARRTAPPADPLRTRALAAVMLAALRVAGQAAFAEPGADHAELLRRTVGAARDGLAAADPAPEPD